MAGLAHWRRLKTPGRPGRIRPMWGVAAGLLIAYAVDAIPPVPLVKRDIAVGHALTQAAGEYRIELEKTPRWVFWRRTSKAFHLAPGERLYCVAAVFAPSGLSTRLYHRWQHYQAGRGWVTTSRIGFNLAGGRQGGYRGYTWKQNLAPGEWKVAVETEDGRTVASHRFEPPIPSTHRLRLHAIDQALRDRIIADRIPVHQYSLAGTIALSYDERRAYWVYYDSQEPFPRGYAYDVIDLDTNTLVTTGQLGGGAWSLAIEEPVPCVLQAPSTVTGPIEGGPVAIHVTPATTCRPWFVLDRRVVNPGPHVGPATLLVQTWANTTAAPSTTAVTLGTQTVLIRRSLGASAPRGGLAGGRSSGPAFGRGRRERRGR